MSENVQIVAMILGTVSSLLTPVMLAWVALINSRVKASNDVIADTNRQLVICAKERDKSIQRNADDAAERDRLKAIQVEEVSTKVDSVAETLRKSQNGTKP